MNNSNKNISPFSYPKSIIKVSGIIMLLVFVNFTFAIQYINLVGTNISLTEIVEEEELEHNHNLFVVLTNNVVIISLINIPTKTNILIAESFFKVPTPPPELS